MSQFECHFETLDGKTLSFGHDQIHFNMTVGDRWQMRCHGSAEAPLKPTSRLVFSQENLEYSLHLLEVKESSTQNFAAIVTGYRPNEYKDVSLEISDGVTTVKTNPMTWKTNSVLNPQEPPEMLPSQGPFLLHYPLWFWLSLGAVFLLMSGSLYYVHYRRRKMKKLMAELESYKTMLSPFAQWSRDVRNLQRKLSQNTVTEISNLFQNLNECFRLYLIRELMVPALQVSDREVMGFIRRKHFRVYESEALHLRRVFSELKNAQKDPGRLNKRDVEDLLSMCHKVAEKIHQLQAGGR